MKETFKLTTLSEADQIKKFGEVRIAGNVEMELVSVRSQYALVENCEFCENKVAEWIHVDRNDEITPELFVHPFANHLGYTDVHPFEVIKHNTALKLTIRAMDAELDNWKPETVVGGFAGHTVNNQTQKYTYSSNEENAVKEIRYSRTERIWKDKYGSRYNLSRRPYKHYDYNF
jgi:hypothetical protein